MINSTWQYDYRIDLFKWFQEDILDRLLRVMGISSRPDEYKFVLVKGLGTLPRLYLITEDGVLALDRLNKVDRGLEAIVAPYRGQARHRRYLRPLCELSRWDRFNLVCREKHPIHAELLDELRETPVARTLSWAELHGLRRINERFHQFGEEDLLGHEGHPREGSLWTHFGRFAEIRNEVRRPVIVADWLTKATLAALRAPRLNVLSPAIWYREELLRGSNDITLTTVEMSGFTTNWMSPKRMF